MQLHNNHFLLIFLAIILSLSLAYAETHYHQFVVQATPVKRLCRTRNIITVNGQFPGPALEARDGDTLVVKVINSARYNVTIHWHGIRQMRTPWADGPEYVTQCPIQPGASYTYRFTIENQEGTLWWHAHSRWLRATVYGALIIRPKIGVPYPFPYPNKDMPLLLGEWWDRDIISVQRQAIFTGAAPNVSDAYTINGQPGDLYRCSSKETAKVYVESGETVLLRIINAALNQELFFSIGNHMLTVVGNDAAYNKPFTTRVVMVGPGQTTNVLLTADQPAGRYYMATRAYATAQNAAFDNTTATAILEYYNSAMKHPRPLLPTLPRFNDTNTVTAYTSQIKSLPSKNLKVPTQIDENLFFTIGLGLVNCTTPGPRCQGPNNTRFAASMNNVSFILPRKTSLLQAYYQNIQGVFTTDFPPVPRIAFDYTGNVSRGLWQPSFGTKLYKLKYGSNVQIVLQDTAIVSTEDHPMHLHGYHFYVVGQGFGNFNPSRDTAGFNLVDPPSRNTINVPVGGWTAIRFIADNPGVWLMHCHIDSHLRWGLAMSFLVENGPGKLQSIEAPPPDLPPC
ncbi:laccase 3 [Perilla frutescens var. hirtella]|uniref:Laccase n=1 Tax=Perilla frutescens var. hirtella TaxID=608512 RepID=A0AAD4JNM5_PERFH|nr:laccase 3 [Perilla frutescens var. hirtella]